MKIKWKSIYYPLGEWNDEECNEVKIEANNFKAVLKNRDIIVLMVEEEGGGGHGDPRFKGKAPKYIYADTLEDTDIKYGDFIDFEITGSSLTNPELTEQ